MYTFIDKPITNFTDFKQYFVSNFGSYIIDKCLITFNNIVLFKIKTILNHINRSNKFYSLIDSNKVTNIIFDSDSMTVIYNWPLINTCLRDTISANNSYYPIFVNFVDIIVFKNNKLWYFVTEDFINNDDLVYYFTKYIKLIDLDHVLVKPVSEFKLCYKSPDSPFVVINNKYLYSFDISYYYVKQIVPVQLSKKEILDKLKIRYNKLHVIGYYSIDAENNKRVYYTDQYNNIIDNLKRYHNTNMNIMYLELYQQNILTDILPHINNYHKDVLNRINCSMKNLSKEILNIYHVTRNKHNNSIYDQLPSSYRNILYQIHGSYIKNRGKKDYFKMLSVSVSDVYDLLKNISFNLLFSLFKDRFRLLQLDDFNEYINKSCIYSLTQMKLLDGST